MWMVSKREKASWDLMTKDVSLKLILSRLQSYTNYTVICHFHLNAWKLINENKSCVINLRNKKLGRRHTLNWYRTKNSSKKQFGEKLLEADEQFSVWKEYGKCKELQRHQTCDNWKKKKLFSVRVKLSHSNCLSENLVAIEMKNDCKNE